MATQHNPKSPSEAASDVVNGQHRTLTVTASVMVYSAGIGFNYLRPGLCEAEHGMVVTSGSLLKVGGERPRETKTQVRFFSKSSLLVREWRRPCATGSSSSLARRVENVAMNLPSVWVTVVDLSSNVADLVAITWKTFSIVLLPSHFPLCFVSSLLPPLH